MAFLSNLSKTHLEIINSARVDLWRRRGTTIKPNYRNLDILDDQFYGQLELLFFQAKLMISILDAGK